MANQLAAARQRRRLSQREAAEQIGVSQPTLSDWERGVIRPRHERLAKMAAVYGVALISRTYGVAISQLQSEGA